MSMKLRIQSSTGVLTKQADHDPLGINRPHLAVDPHPRVGMILNPPQDAIHSLFMTLHHVIPN